MYSAEKTKTIHHIEYNYKLNIVSNYIINNYGILNIYFAEYRDIRKYICMFIVYYHIS